MTVYSVIIGSPPEGSILPSGAFGSRGWWMKASTPAERLNIAFKFGKSGSRPKSGRMKARYSMSAGLPASGQMRISISGSCAAKLSRHASALPIILSRLTMSSAIFPLPGPAACSRCITAPGGKAQPIQPISDRARRRDIKAAFPGRSGAMPKALTEAQIAQYREAGYLAPIRIIDEDEALGLRARLQEVAFGVDGTKAVMLVLRAGAMALQHVRLVHGSAPNASMDRRIGYAIRYIPAPIRQLEGEDSATLVRGADHYGHFELEPHPEGEMTPAMLALHKRIAERNAKILYRGTGVESFNDAAALRG